MANDITQHDSPDFGAGYELLEALKAEGVLTEARYNIIRNVTMIMESRQNTPTSYVYLDRLISWEVFKAVYTDFDRYEGISDIWKGLGYPRELFDESGKSADENMSKQLRRIVAHFAKTNNEASNLLVNPSARMKAYSQRFKGARDDHSSEDDYFREPTRDDVDPGRRGRVSNASRAIEKINSQELLSGQFYSDFSRIPPSRWGNWLRFWDQEKTSVQQDKRLFGRSWKKTFVLGYQIEKNLVYEIWYNSLDSSFTVHDFRGNQVSRRFPTLSEATRALINALVQSSSEDAEFFRSGMNNQIATSLMRSVAGGLDTHIADLQRLDDKEQAAEMAARQEAEKKQAAQDAIDKAAKRRAEETRRANVEFFKNDIKQAGKRAFRDFGKIVERFGVPGADSALDKFRSGAVSLDQFLQNVVDTLELVGSKDERNLRDALKADEIDLSDYIKGTRELAAKKRADIVRRRNEENAKKRTSQTGKSPSDMSDYLSRKGPQTEFAFESLIANNAYIEAQKETVDDALGSDHVHMIRTLRKDAAHGAFTQSSLKNSVNSELISVYTETRVEQNFPNSILPQWVNKGRKDPIILPTDKPSLWNRAKMLIKGIRYQADFIIGFSLADRINIEIWYVTEPNPEHSLSAFGATDSFSMKPAVSSFYVFDVTSGRLLRKYVPYYRNAVQVAMAKLSAQ